MPTSSLKYCSCDTKVHLFSIFPPELVGFSLLSISCFVVALLSKLYKNHQQGLACMTSFFLYHITFP